MLIISFIPFDGKVSSLIDSITLAHMQDSPCSTPQSRSLDDKTFEGFTYCAPSILAAAMDEQHASKKMIESFHPSSK